MFDISQMYLIVSGYSLVILYKFYKYLYPFETNEFASIIDRPSTLLEYPGTTVIMMVEP